MALKLSKPAWLAMLGLPAMVYAGICGLMYAKQRDLIYYGQYTRVDPATTDFALEREGVHLRGWAVNPTAPRPLLYFGGNAERIEQRRDQLAQLFPDRSVYLLAYRGFGASDGQPSEAALFGDALSFYDRVRAAHPGQAIDVIGCSLGSGVASHVASQRPVARLALVTPFDSLASVAQSHYPLLPVGWLVRDRFESARWLAGYRGPTLVLRAGLDQVIPAGNTDRLIAALATPPRVVALAQADHSSIGAEPAFEQALREFFAAPDAGG
ncbi:alpha/beta hydrolase [Lysobacter sp. 5GHs7-4]|uniref:alpha/beta hydrolase n=1 Tax=Lysobacter sp. 5GHs7-4 TaxID=2904253 RepID=UPI001E33E6E1|nr:alpha/beta fold hydrolase [Lysobacter sp. 5GHs7-4]UHQ21394.1 alpha/beta hydrolase [Lysobacter sp. 5GHs7-4]